MVLRDRTGIGSSRGGTLPVPSVFAPPPPTGVLPVVIRSEWGTADGTSLCLVTPPFGLLVGVAESAGHALLVASSQRGSGHGGLGVICAWRPDPAVIDGSIDEPLTLLEAPASGNSDVELWALFGPSPSAPGGGEVRMDRNAGTRQVLAAVLVSVASLRDSTSVIWPTDPDPSLAGVATGPFDLLIGAIAHEGYNDLAPLNGDTDILFAGAGNGTASPISLNLAAFLGAAGDTVQWVAGSNTYALAVASLIG